MATENSGFCTVVPPTGTRRMHKQKLGVADLPRDRPPKRSARHGYLFALSGRSFRAYAGCSATSGTGTSWPRGFHNFPDFSGTGHGKNPEVSRQAPFCRALQTVP
ncbi:hypothetical protein EVAR_61145_1 [Eumeta japonica]|uniref:Uncharacterized protein n=1 Tax=Eumeta variegata TaxID=151549 RepID=A0A4C2ABE5_EUMVA|nr:hypothetical protein EVAR_61145_1 [Eumeta japonica]